jgi:hypothetical protein
MHIRSRSEEAQEIKKEVGKRDSWLNRFRRILIRWEKKLESYLECFTWLAG